MISKLHAMLLNEVDKLQAKHPDATNEETFISVLMAALCWQNARMLEMNQLMVELATMLAEKSE